MGFNSAFKVLKESCSLTKFQMTPTLCFLISSGSKKKEPRYVYLSEANASHSHKTLTEVSSSVPHFLQVGLFISPIIYRFLLKVEELKTNLMSLAILFHFLCAQHVSDINISIICSLRLCCCITTSVVLFSVRCVLELWCGWF